MNQGMRTLPKERGPKGGPCMFTSEHGTIHLLRKKAGIGEIEQWPHSRVPTQVSMDREKTTIEGTLDNDATFEYNVEISHKGLNFWGEIKEKEQKSIQPL